MVLTANYIIQYLCNRFILFAGPRNCPNISLYLIRSIPMSLNTKFEVYVGGRKGNLYLWAWYLIFCELTMRSSDVCQLCYLCSELSNYGDERNQLYCNGGEFRSSRWWNGNLVFYTRDKEGLFEKNRVDYVSCLSIKVIFNSFDLFRSSFI